MKKDKSKITSSGDGLDEEKALESFKAFSSDPNTEKMMTDAYKPSPAEKVTAETIEKFIFESGSDNVGYFGGKFEGGIQCQHTPDELAECLFAIMESDWKIKSYLDVGTVAGGTVVVVDKFFKPGKIEISDDHMHAKTHLRQYVLEGIKYYNFTESPEDDLMFDLIMIDINQAFYPEIIDAVDNFGIFLNPGGFMIIHDSLSEWWGGSRVVKKLKKDKEFEFVNEYKSKTHPQPLGTALFRRVNKK